MLKELNIKIKEYSVAADIANEIIEKARSTDYVDHPMREVSLYVMQSCIKEIIEFYQNKIDDMKDKIDDMNSNL